MIPPKTGSVRLQFDVTLPDDVLAAAADALRRHPDVALRAYGRRVDPTLGWLDGFEHVEHLSLDLRHATSFDVLAGFRNLRSLGLGQTRSRRPALGSLRDLTQLEELGLEAHDRDFAAVGDVKSLRRLALRVPRSKTLDPLRGHTNLEVFDGGIRDLSPTAGPVRHAASRPPARRAPRVPSAQPSRRERHLSGEPEGRAARGFHRRDARSPGDGDVRGDIGDVIVRCHLVIADCGAWEPARGAGHRSPSPRSGATVHRCPARGFRSGSSCWAAATSCASRRRAG